MGRGKPRSGVGCGFKFKKLNILIAARGWGFKFCCKTCFCCQNVIVKHAFTEKAIAFNKNTRKMFVFIKKMYIFATS